MDAVAQGFQEAAALIFSFDGEVYGIIGLSLYVSLASVCISSCLGVPLGILLGVRQFRLKRLMVRIIYTLMSLPPVVAGLVVFLFIMRRGPLGSWGITYTPAAMIIAQVVLVSPIIIGLTYNIVKEKAAKVQQLAKTLGAGRISGMKLLIFELRIGIMAAVVTGFGRAISEVGAVMIVGGNIRGKTRVMTTYIAQLQNMGDYSRAIAIGIVLLLIAFAINAVLYNMQETERI